MRAAELGTRLTSSGDDDPTTLVNLGVARAGLGQFDDAVAAYRKVLSGPSPPVQTSLYIGLSLYRSGHKPEAFDWFRKFIAADPKSEAAGRLGRLLELSGAVSVAAPSAAPAAAPAAAPSAAPAAAPSPAPAAAPAVKPAAASPVLPSGAWTPAEASPAPAPTGGSR